MSFIDRTYFAGDLHIAQLQQTPVQEKLDFFISIYEPECCRKLFGYEFYTEFSNGLLESSPEQKWLDLRDGVEFTGYNGRIKKWMGLTGNTNAVPLSKGFRPSEQIQADITTGFVSDTNTVTFDGTSGKPDYRGWKMIPERIGTGTMWTNDDYSWNPTTGVWLLLKANDKFAHLEKFDIRFEPYTTSTTVTNAAKQSIIANYVYDKWMRDVISSSTGIGEVKPQGDNASSDNPGWKMMRAWTQLMGWVKEMDEFLRLHRDDYPNYQYHILPREFFHTVNPLGI